MGSHGEPSPPTRAGEPSAAHTVDPSAPARPGSGLFGLDTRPEEARVHVLGVPWEPTTSYRRGTADGPAAILRASHQVDLFDLWNGRPYEAGIWMAPPDGEVAAWNAEACEHAERVIEAGGVLATEALVADRDRVDALSAALNERLHGAARAALEDGRLVGVVGGDHASPFGSIRAHAERFPGMGILHVDAHADLRVAYEGFRWSHASILHNVTRELDVGPVLQVGIRDLSEEEHDAIAGSGGRIRAVFGHGWARARAEGANLRTLVRDALQALPAEVYVTFDVDGLDPTLCPNTGTPVPGGLWWDEAMLWLDELVRSGRRIVGFDLNEVAPGTPSEGDDGIDAIVGARLLYRLIGFTLRSQTSATTRDER